MLGSPEGKSCSKKLTKRKKCHIPCTKDMKHLKYNFHSFENIRIDCVMSIWSTWTKCSEKCEPNKFQERYRRILVHPTPNGTPCPNKIEKRLCPCRGENQAYQQ